MRLEPVRSARHEPGADTLPTKPLLVVFAHFNSTLIIISSQILVSLTNKLFISTQKTSL